MQGGGHSSSAHSVNRGRRFARTRTHMRLLMRQCAHSIWLRQFLCHRQRPILEFRRQNGSKRRGRGVQ
jgi:hypothetical protein